MKSSRIALDVATRMGVAVKTKEGIHTFVLKGDPIRQLDDLIDILGEDELKDATVFIEQLNYFRNASTVRSLAGRIGYLEHSLRKLGANVEMVSATAARKYLGVKTKDDVRILLGGSSDEADATAILLLGLRNLGEEIPLDTETQRGLTISRGLS